MSLTKNIIAHAQNVYPQESCGLVVDGVYVPCTNVAQNPLEDFEIAINEWQPCEVVVHSHPNGERYLSGADRTKQVATRADWWLVANNQIIKYPCIPHLKAREFNYGVADCCSIVVDAYRLANIKLTDAQRLGIDEDIEHGTIVNAFNKTGFYQVNIGGVKDGDVILTKHDQNPSKASHAGLYLGNEQVLHHELGKLSRVVCLHEFIALDTNNIHSVWRHPQWRAGSIQAIINDLNAS